MPQGLKAESGRFIVYGLKPVPTGFHAGSKDPIYLTLSSEVFLRLGRRF
jgi:hypothetical protein